MNRISFIQVVQSGCKLTHSKRLEDPVREGRNACLTSIFQISAIQSAITYVDYALCLTGRHKVSCLIRLGLYATPPFTAAIIKRGIKNDTVRLAFFLFQERVGAMCQIACAICSFVFIYFGAPLHGGVSLLILAVGVLDHRSLLPTNATFVLHRCIEPLVALSSLFTNIGFEFFIFAGQLLFAGTGRYLYWKKKREKEAIVQQQESKEGRLHYKDLRKVFVDPVQFRVNREYVHYFHMESINEIDIEELDSLFNSINWSAHKNSLCAKLKNDHRFVEKYGDPEKKPDEELISYIKAELHALVDGVKQRTIFPNNPQDFERVRSYLTHTINILCANRKKEILVVDVMMKLSIEAGGYCDQGRLEVIEEIYGSLMELDQITPLRTRILHYLQQKRMYWVQKLYAEGQAKGKWQLIHRMIDWNDRHTYIQTINALFGDALGLQRTDIDEESSATAEALTRCFMGWIRNQIIEKFWREHTASDIVETIRLAIGNSLPKTDVYQWWKDWGEREDFSNKELFQEDLSEGRLLGNPLEVLVIIERKPKYCFTFESLQAMLFDMGILEISN